MVDLIYVKKLPRTCRDCYCDYYVEMPEGVLADIRNGFVREGLCCRNQCVYTFSVKKSFQNPPFERNCR